MLEITQALEVQRLGFDSAFLCIIFLVSLGTSSLSLNFLIHQMGIKTPTKML